MAKLSICIFAYKQSEQVKHSLDEIASYDGNDIEVIVSDDTPDDSIKELVESYADDRICYVKNGLGAGADGNYLNAIMSATSEYAWVFRSSDCVVPDKVAEVIKEIEKNPECVLYFPSSAAGDRLRKRTYKNMATSVVWSSGTLHPSGYIINKKYCEFDLYKEYIIKYFGDYIASNVAFCLLQADVGLKGETYFSATEAWKYALTVARDDKAENAPGGKNPFGLEFEYKRYALMLDYANSISEDMARDGFVKKVIHTYAKQILHIFGKRNSSEDFLNHYGCERVEFSSFKERKKFEKETRKIFESLGVNIKPYLGLLKKEAFVYGIVKPSIYRIKHI